MATFFEIKRRTLIPNWRSFDITSKTGELNGFNLNKEVSFSIEELNSLSNKWNSAKTLGVAADIVNFCFMHKLSDFQTGQEAAQLIQKNRENCSLPLFQMSEFVINKFDEKRENEYLEVPSIDIFKDDKLVDFLHKKINGTRNLLNRNHRNLILRVELSRLYTILGQDEKAKRQIELALSLSPNNRFVLRAAARFFAHIDNLEIAHDILRKSTSINEDPWLLSTEISLALLRGRTSKFIGKSFEIIKAKDFSSQSLTELHSTLATIEMYSGSHKNSSLLFAKSLESPNDNSLAQAEWASVQHKEITLSQINYVDIVNPFEAESLEAYNKQNWAECINYCIKWFLDMPFTKRPIYMAEHISRAFLNDLNKSTELCRIGLISNPKDLLLLNNMAYNLCMLGRLEEAEEKIEEASGVKIENYVHRICLMATKGLLLYKKKDFKGGRILYLKAMDECKSNNDKNLFKIAFLNYLREELLIQSEDSKSLFEIMPQIIKKTDNQLEIETLRNEILEIVAKNRR